jgi:hypothetical protein
MKWLFAGPIPERSLEKDFLASLGGRQRAIPAPGAAFACGRTTFRFAPLEPNCIWTSRHSANRPTIDCTAAHGRTWRTTGCYFTVLANDKPRYVTLKLLLPGAGTWKARLDTAIWLGGTPIAERQVIHLAPGRWPLMIQASMGQCEPWGKIFMLPRFLDVTAAATKSVAEHRAALARWRRYQDEPKAFVLGK